MARRAGSSSLFTLLRIVDSLFPSGAFAHSYGLEALFAGGDGAKLSEAQSAIEAIWRGHLLRTDQLLGAAAHRAAVVGDIDQVAVLDRRLYSMKLVRELREASVTTGRSFLSVAAASIGGRDLARFAALVDAGDSPGNYAIAFAVAAAAAGIGAKQAVVGLAYQTLAQLTAALLRLGVVGHRDAQSLLEALRAGVERGTRRVLAEKIDDGSSFAPRLEIASMRHERQYSRLFRS